MALTGVAVAATLGASANFLHDAIKREGQYIFYEQRNDVTKSLYSRLEEAFAEIKGQNEKIGDISNAIRQLPDDAQSRALIGGFDERLKSIQSRLKTIEDVIVQDPQKSLSIVVMKRDLDTMQKSSDDRYLAQNLSIERLYNMFGWSIGALIIAVAAQLLAGFFGRRRDNEPA